MRSYDLKMDVTGTTGLPGQLSTAVTVYLPDRIDSPLAVLFGFPGGGYGRRYYDIQSLPGYSQAEHHTKQGFAFVACDHLGVGDSDQPDTFALTYENLAAANNAAARSVVAGLREGTLVDGMGPTEVSTVVGMGQSMGGCLLTVQQANHGTFDGVAFLGWSGTFTNFPAPDGGRIIYPMPQRGTDLRPIAHQVLGGVGPDDSEARFCFHWPDQEPELVEADLATFKPYTGVVRGDETTPWGSGTVPACAITMMTDGAVAKEAAAIDVPVMVACGERDVVPDPWAESSAFRGSSQVSLRVVPRMAHMHNFARTRKELWDALANFAQGVRPRQSATADTAV
ncbi:alpha/beta hydrolase [Gordonia polyisoprenivorans]|uniref:alpha/beta hydrolase n=1 Tax=Gordonia polyisoprenivorans TaxID=84595 RepID=UPI001AD76BA3|nr:alpha/beta hydrolase [Gordonia polyisoprenivorans]QTI70962.1 alpha/beta hydrolase [Gordonia polyisoprenivorans]